MDNTNSKVLVVFRTLPGEADHALVLPVSNLAPQDHDTIMTLVETAQAQQAFEFGEIMFIRTFSDGRSMLKAARADGILVRVPTDKVIMTPDTVNQIRLSDLNVLIAEQKNCAVDDLYTFVSGATKVDNVAQVKELGEPTVPEYEDPDAGNDAAKTVAESYTDTTPEAAADPVAAQAPVDGVLSDADLAKGMRSQADAMFKEAQRLRREADELDPKPAKATSKKAPATKAKTTKAKTTKAKTTKAKDGVSD